MAAEIDEITESNQPDIAGQVAHILIDLHDALKMLRDMGLVQARHDALLRRYEPLLKQFESPAAAYMTRRAQRRNNGG